MNVERQTAIREPLQRLLVHIPQEDRPLIGEAYHFANASHEGQDRDAGQPFITHPIGVALILASELGFGRDAEMMAAALLHDAVEDSALTLEDIEPTFGKTVAELVSGVTKVTGTKASRDARRIATLQHLFTAAHKDPRVLILKLADRVHNMRSLDGISELSRRQRIAQDTTDIYAPLSHFLGMGRIRRELEDRSLRCMEPDAIDKIQNEIETAPPEHILQFQNTIRDLLKQNGVRSGVRMRPKSLASIFRKMQQNNLSLDQIPDRYAIEIIVSRRLTCYLSLGILHERYLPVMERFKDFIALPRRNGYQALHTHVHSSGQRYELHIQTPSMHRLGEFGVASLRGDTQREERRMRWLHEFSDWHDRSAASHHLMAELKRILFTSEIVAITPTGDPFILPEGATVVDFAFAVHTDLGLRCKGGRINGARAYPFSTLAWGDTVEIETEPDQHPKKGWVSRVKTYRARRHIQRYLNNETSDQSAAP
ncbi:MAG: HD domain-containing protein [Candidatus Latescibacteria bacterium]|jgi:GTP pyrophosphokinase|nr:HD domain-containing protein [Candidatus Latescibacterota bacterium]